MKKTLLTIIMLTSLASLLDSCCSRTAPRGEVLAGEDPYVIVGYVTSWGGRIPDPSLVTHYNYAFGHVTDSFDSVRIDNPERLRSIVALKDSNPDLKVLISVGGWGSGRFSEMAASEQTRRSFAANYILSKGLRGAMYWDSDNDDDTFTLSRTIWNHLKE